MPRRNQFYRASDASNFLVPGGGQTGVFRVLEKAAMWHRIIPTEATRSVCVKTRIASNEAWIAQVINDFSNPPNV